MKFIYLGCEGAPDVSIHYGVEFAIGVPSDVVDEAAIAKLTNHPHFALTGESSRSADADLAADDERAVTLDLARSLGIRIGRKSADTLKREIAEAQGACDADQN